jgi:hypothetical protein
MEGDGGRRYLVGDLLYGILGLISMFAHFIALRESEREEGGICTRLDRINIGLTA